jgi:hypothetical protein
MLAFLMIHLLGSTRTGISVKDRAVPVLSPQLGDLLEYSHYGISLVPRLTFSLVIWTSRSTPGRPSSLIDMTMFTSVAGLLTHNRRPKPLTLVKSEENNQLDSQKLQIFSHQPLSSPTFEN